MKQSQINAQDVIDMYDSGKSTYEVAKHFNIYPNMVARILKKNGRKLRDRSEAQKQALANGTSEHPTKGKKHSDSTKLILSEKTKSKWENLNSDERERRINISKQRWAEMSEDKKKDIQSLAAKGVRKAATDGSKLENFILDKLLELGYNATAHAMFLENSKLECDIYVSDSRTVIEIDGPTHYENIWGDDKLAKVQKADLEKNGLVLSKDFAMIRIRHSGNPASLVSQYKLIEDLDEILLSFKNDFPVNSVDRFVELTLE